MSKGQKVSFELYDNLFKDVIVATGVLVDNVFGRLWWIQPDKHDRLSGGNVMVHEVNIHE